jgi:hypothetical protein
VKLETLVQSLGKAICFIFHEEITTYAVLVMGSIKVCDIGESFIHIPPSPTFRTPALKEKRNQLMRLGAGDQSGGETFVAIRNTELLNSSLLSLENFSVVYTEFSFC